MKMHHCRHTLRNVAMNGYSLSGNFQPRKSKSYRISEAKASLTGISVFWGGERS